jgi:hypothetical protein
VSSHTADFHGYLWFYARPLPPDRRDAFCQEAQDALTRLRVLGPGVAHRTVTGLLPGYFVPVPDDETVGPNHHRPSKLASGAPIA